MIFSDNSQMYGPMWFFYLLFNSNHIGQALAMHRNRTVSRTARKIIETHYTILEELYLKREQNQQLMVEEEVLKTEAKELLDNFQASQRQLDVVNEDLAAHQTVGFVKAENADRQIAKDFGDMNTKILRIARHAAAICQKEKVAFNQATISTFGDLLGMPSLTRFLVHWSKQLNPNEEYSIGPITLPIISHILSQHLLKFVFNTFAPEMEPVESSFLNSIYRSIIDTDDNDSAIYWRVLTHSTLSSESDLFNRRQIGTRILNNIKKIYGNTSVPSAISERVFEVIDDALQIHHSETELTAFNVRFDAEYDLRSIKPYDTHTGHSDEPVLVLTLGLGHQDKRYIRRRAKVIHGSSPILIPVPIHESVGYSGAESSSEVAGDDSAVILSTAGALEKGFRNLMAEI